ncbi:MAG: anti-sigma factor antagonist [Christensenellales bacterium]
MDWQGGNHGSSCKKESNNLVIFLIGELDEYTAPYTRSAIDKALDGYKSADIIFDLSGLTFMDSTGIGVLISKYKQLKGADSRLYVRKPSKSIDKIFNMAGLYSIMPKIS